MATGDLFLKLDTSEKINKFYNGDLEPDTLIAKPILQPLAQISKPFESFQLLISKRLTEYIESLEEFRKITSTNQIYKRTEIYRVVTTLLNCASDIINHQNIQLEDARYAVEQMVEKNNRFYVLGDVSFKINPLDEKKDVQQEILEKEMKPSIAESKTEIKENPYKVEFQV